MRLDTGEASPNKLKKIRKIELYEVSGI